MPQLRLASASAEPHDHATIWALAIVLFFLFIFAVVSQVQARRRAAEIRKQDQKMIAEITDRLRAETTAREALQKMDTLIGTTDTGYVIIDDQGCVEDANPEYVRLTGHKHVREILGRSVIEWTAEHDLERNRQEVEKCIHSGQVRDLEIDFVGPDGTITQVEINATVVRTDKGMQILTLCRDISLRKTALEALHHSEERYREIAERSSDGMAVVQDDSVQFVNTKAAEMLGHTVADMTDCHFSRFVAPSQLKSVAAAFEHVAAGDEDDQRYETVLVCKEGREIDVELHVCATINDDRRAAFAFIQDITERKASEHALRQSEQKFRSIIESSPMGMLMYELRDNDDLIFTGASPAASEILGVDCGKFVGKRIEDAFPPLAETEVPDAYRKVAREGTSWSTSQIDYDDHRIRGAYEVHAFATGPRRMTAMFLDITERLKSEQETQRFRQILEKTVDLVGIAGLQGEHLYLNQAGRQILGIGLDEDISKMIVTDFHTPEAIEIIKNEAFPEALANGVWQGETTFLSRTGREIPMLQVIVAHKNSDGEPEILSTIARDISDIRAQEREIHELNEELEERVKRRTKDLEAVNKELEAFCYSVSHDLRAPLRSINGFSQALLEDYSSDLDKTARDYLKRVRQSTERMNDLIENLLTLSRLSRAELNLGSVNLSRIGREVFEDLRRRDPQRNVEALVQPRMTISSGDLALMRGCLENLLGNAWKFTSKKELARIEFGRYREHGETVYYVRDNGAGFDECYIHRLFGVFQRLHSQDDFEGTGVGLANVQRIIHRHGGRIWAAGDVGKGATFYFTLSKWVGAEAKEPVKV